MPVLASFNNTDLFGVGVQTRGPSYNPRRAQSNTYPGVNGIEELEMGDDGMFTTVTGMLVGETLSDLNTQRIVLMSYYDGNTYQLVDNYGLTWNNVKMVSLEWPERGKLTPAGWIAEYSARFKHLTLS